MKAAVYYANDDVRVEERPIPTAGPGEIVVRVAAAGVCGSDVMEWYRKPKAPVVLGHEIAGTVEEVGAGSIRWAAGDRVVVTHHVPCNTCPACLAGHGSACDVLRKTKLDPGGFAEYVRVPALQTDRGVVPIPDDVSFEEAAFFEPLGCALHGLERARFAPAKSVAVIGAGLAGLLMVSAARALGAGRIAAVEPAADRRAAAERLGAERTFDAGPDAPARIREATDGRGADLVAVCTAARPALEQAFQAVARGGVVLFFSVVEPGVSVPLPLHEVWRDDVTIATAYAAGLKDLAAAAELIRSRRVPVAEMITHRLPLAEAAEAFRLTAAARGSLKVILRPHGLAD